MRKATDYFGGGKVQLSETQNLAIQACIALIVGAKAFDRLFASVRFDEADGPLLFAYAKDEETASEIEDNYALRIAIIASRILKREVEIVLVLPKVLQ
jgi:hypothetical protein